MIIDSHQQSYTIVKYITEQAYRKKGDRKTLDYLITLLFW
jgi:hypothetical protein